MDSGHRETDIGGEPGGFQPTLWTVVLRAKDPASPERREALDRLIQTYWKPAYYFIRRRGHSVEAAKDLTQAYFASFLEKDLLQKVSPEKGKFRSFLMATLTYFLSDEYDRSRALKRGAQFDFESAEADLEDRDITPEEAFFRQWALEIFSRAMDSMRAEYSVQDMALLTGAEAADLSPTDRKNRLHRLKARFREHLRVIIRPSVQNESDVEDEMREILTAIR